MKKHVTTSLRSVVLAGIAALGTGMAVAQPAQPQERPVETQALQALQRMSNYLNTLKQFEVKSDIDTDYLSTDGQVVTKTRQVDLRARLPDGLYASVGHPTMQRDLYFNGKLITLYAPGKGYYATADAPASNLHDLISGLNQKYGIDVPLSDLFEWSRNSANNVMEFEAARYAGAAYIGGQLCDQYVYRSQGAQWQLWVQRSDTPLPCRLSIADDGAERLRTTITYHWNTAAKFAPSQFVFKPPQGAMKIELVKAKAE